MRDVTIPESGPWETEHRCSLDSSGRGQTGERCVMELGSHSHGRWGIPQSVLCNPGLQTSWCSDTVRDWQMESQRCHEFKDRGSRVSKANTEGQGKVGVPVKKEKIRFFFFLLLKIFINVLNGLNGVWPHWWGWIFFAQSLDSNDNLFQNRHTQNKMKMKDALWKQLLRIFRQWQQAWVKHQAFGTQACETTQAEYPG